MPTLFRRVILVVLVTVLLGAVTSSAAPLRGPGPAGATVFDLLDLLRTALTSVWAAASDEGCGIDPDGHCTATPAAESDIGCGIDPDGHCATSPASEADEGCGIDPNGHCASGR